MTVRKLLIVGATGQQGGAVLNALQASHADFSIYGLTRDPTSASATKLALRNVAMIQGDLSEPNAIFKKIGGQVWGVFCVTQRGKNEEKQGNQMVDAAIANGVQYFVFTSADRGGPEISDRNPTIVPHPTTKHNIEKHLIANAARGSHGMEWTILRPVTFMDNFAPIFVGKMMTRIMEQIGDVRLQFISTEDIGKAAARVFENPHRHQGKALTLAADSLNYREMNSIFREEFGFDHPIAPAVALAFIKWVVSSDIKLMSKWFSEGVYAGDLDPNGSELPEAKDFRTWLRTSSRWKASVQKR